MADISIFFVVAFSRTEANELRAEAAIKARSKQHAASLASHFVCEGQGAVAFSQMRGSATAGGNVEILARFGDVPDDRALLYWFGSVWASGRRGDTSAPAHPFARSTPLTHSLRRLLSRIMPFVAQRQRNQREGPSHSLAWLAAVAITMSGSFLLGIAAWGAQREARLLEMARPVCDHTDTTNEELHRLVKYGYKVGASKKEALETIITLCLTKSPKSG